MDGKPGVLEVKIGADVAKVRFYPTRSPAQSLVVNIRQGPLQAVGGWLP